LSGSYGAVPEFLLPLAKFEEGNAHHATPNAGEAIPTPAATPADALVREDTAPADPAETPAARYDRRRFHHRLLGQVRHRAGNPKDLLGLDVDLEADLGIDSIKRIEILSEVTTDLGTDAQSMVTELEMEKLTVIRTLRGIIDYLDNALRFNSDAASSGTVIPT